MNIEETSFIGSLKLLELRSFVNILEAYKDNCYPTTINNIMIKNITGSLCLELDNGIILSSIYNDDVIYSTEDLSKDRIYPDIQFLRYSEALDYIGL